MKNKKAVAYVQISSAKQIDNESPETQKAIIQKYAHENSIEVVEWFFDEAKSGKNTDRPALKELLEYAIAHKNELDYWLVYNMRRASRDIDTYVSGIKSILQKLGIHIRSATEPVVDESPVGRFMENLLLIVGQFDNDNKTQTTKDNMRSLAEQGYW